MRDRRAAGTGQLDSQQRSLHSLLLAFALYSPLFGSNLAAQGLLVQLTSKSRSSHRWHHTQQRPWQRFGDQTLQQVSMITAQLLSRHEN